MATIAHDYYFTFSSFKTHVPFLDITINIGSPWTYILTFGSVCLYLILILFHKRSSKPEFESWARIHHGALFIYSTFIFSVTFMYLFQKDELSSFKNFMCVPIPPWLRFLSITFTISKIWEWGDTLVHLWRNESLSKIGFLHLYHHATTFFSVSAGYEFSLYGKVWYVT